MTTEKVANTQTPQTAPSYSGGNIMDIMLDVEIMLVLDYDNQLVSMKNQMKSSNKIKKSYRSEIEQLTGFLTRESKKSKETGDVDCVSLTQKELESLNTDIDPTFDNAKNEVDFRRKPTEVPIKSKGKHEVPKVDPKTNKPTKEKEYVGEWVPKDAIEKKIEIYKSKLENLNEQSELMSLDFQSLTNQRKIAFETMSNMMSKYNETLSTIVRNLKG